MRQHKHNRGIAKLSVNTDTPNPKGLGREDSDMSQMFTDRKFQLVRSNDVA